MRTLFALVLTMVTLGAPVLPAQTPTPIGTPANAADPKIYGEYPLAYQAITTRWMNERLADPASAVFEWIGEPTPGEMTKDGQRLVGYFVNFKVNARNQFGGATGKQKYRVLIRNGVVFWGGRPRS